jgi:uncharacterized protein
VTLCDASVLIALLNRQDPNHDRCRIALPQLSEPLISTWACLVEAMYLLQRYGGWTAQQTLWQFIEKNKLLLHKHNEAELERMQHLMEQYKNVPMDLGDASLVTAAETLDQRLIFTLDRDFYIYRFRDTQAFEVVPSP